MEMKVVKRERERERKNMDEVVDLYDVGNRDVSTYKCEMMR